MNIYVMCSILTTVLNILLHKDILLRPIWVSHQGLPLDFVFGKYIAVDGHSDVDKETRFIEQIQDIHQAV